MTDPHNLRRPQNPSPPPEKPPSHIWTCAYDATRGGFDIYFGVKAQSWHGHSLFDGLMWATVDQDSRIGSIGAGRRMGLGNVLAPPRPVWRLPGEHPRRFSELVVEQMAESRRAGVFTVGRGGQAGPFRVIQSPEEIELWFDPAMDGQAPNYHDRDLGVTIWTSRGAVSLFALGAVVAALRLPFAKILAPYPLEAIKLVYEDIK